MNRCMVLEDSANVPRDLKQVQNRKHLESKKKRRQMSNNADLENRIRKNTADDRIALLNEVHEHPFIQ